MLFKTGNKLDTVIYKLTCSAGCSWQAVEISHTRVSENPSSSWLSITCWKFLHNGIYTDNKRLGRAMRCEYPLLLSLIAKSQPLIWSEQKWKFSLISLSVCLCFSLSMSLCLCLCVCLCLCLCLFLSVFVSLSLSLCLCLSLSLCLCLSLSFSQKKINCLSVARMAFPCWD